MRCAIVGDRLRPEVVEWFEWQCWWEGEADQGRLERMGVAVGVDEDEVAGPEGLDTPVLFVEPVVVVPACEHEVVEVGVAVVGPVDAVVGVAAPGCDGAAEDASAVVA